MTRIRIRRPYVPMQPFTWQCERCFGSRTVQARERETARGELIKLGWYITESRILCPGDHRQSALDIRNAEEAKKIQEFVDSKKYVRNSMVQAQTAAELQAGLVPRQYHRFQCMHGECEQSFTTEARTYNDAVVWARGAGWYVSRDDEVKACPLHAGWERNQYEGEGAR